MMNIYSNALIYNTEAEKFMPGSLLVSDGRIADILPPETVAVIGADSAVDLGGARVIPGMVDIHTHGRGGYESTEVDGEGMLKLAEAYAAAGTTSFMATLMSTPFEQLESAVDAAICAKDKGGANILGIYLEGRYISFAKKGAHMPENIAPHDPDELERLIDRAKPLGRFHTICAPEMPGADRLIERAVRSGATVSIGHSNATCRQCYDAMELGASSFTHLYNAMSPLGHREPGCVGAALSSDAYAELICDGVHVSPEAVRIAYRAKGNGRIALITDSAPSAGLPEGEYRMGGADVVVRDGAVFLRDGTLTGGSISLFEAMLKLTEFAGITLEEALPCATLIPAKIVGADGEVGSLEVGKRADFIVLDADDRLSRVFIGGKSVR